MIQNISIRVPWHDNKWNGTICKDPRHNVSCLRLKAISQSKDEDYECENCGNSIHGYEKTYIAFVKVAFLCHQKQ